MIHYLLSKTHTSFFIVDSSRRNIRAIEGGEKRNEGEGVMHKRTVERQREKEKKSENLSGEIDR